MFVNRNDFGQQINTGLVIDTRVKENVIEQVILQQRLLQFLRQATEAAPVVRHGTTPVRNQRISSLENP